MKKINIKIFISAALIALATSSCVDLDVDVKSKYTSYPDSEIAIEAKTSDVYYAFRGALGRRYSEAMSFSSDECMGVSYDGDYYDSGNYAHPSLHNFMADDACMGYWPELSSGITKCNQVIVDLGGEEEVVTAPARAVRAFYHFILMDSYGDVPILDHMLDADEALERSPRADVAEWIESELIAIRDNMTTAVDASTYGKPTRWMVNALLAKLYINWNVYTQDVTSSSWSATAANEKLNDCVSVCDDIIQSGIFNLSDDYLEKFYPTNGVQIKDFIYAMPYTASNNDGLTYGRFRTWRKGDSDGDGGAGLYGIKLAKSAAGNFAVNPEFADLFNLEGDRRNDAIFKGALYQYDPSTYEVTSIPFMYKGEQVVLTKDITLKVEDENLNVGNDAAGWSQGYRFNKFMMDPTDYGLYGRNQDNDVPIFRYADILLTKCEAILRGATPTNGDTPMSLFNQIRSYVNAPVISAEPSLDELLDERGREFFDENWRRNDLIRFGRFEDDWGYKNIINPSAKTDYTKRIFPVPTGVLNENTNWMQNSGY
ncbi:Starch-binding associating with outer membrane [Draconibacterium orientale]|uniref:Glycan metabolism protein RagB n=1 Tax=Draconibacterium orientale TaxID=1168034 RepID=X5DED8_9BACT|nr:RagB/SusD family nutrient uptake outer membrane protein [Draconibacterium orientale]AHW59374.1 glycan metabolism protein RagB [Draconibacterium orientale]SEU14340.1 Starch-binding associating with outer membrane [Draconibacterium orientale]